MRGPVRSELEFGVVGIRSREIVGGDPDEAVIDSRQVVREGADHRLEVQRSIGTDGQRAVGKAEDCREPGDIPVAVHSSDRRAPATFGGGHHDQRAVRACHRLCSSADAVEFTGRDDLSVTVQNADPCGPPAVGDLIDGAVVSDDGRLTCPAPNRRRGRADPYVAGRCCARYRQRRLRRVDAVGDRPPRRRQQSEQQWRGDGGIWNFSV